MRADKAVAVLGRHHGSTVPMYHGNWYGKGGDWAAAYALAALQGMATKGGWSGSKGGSKGLSDWAKGGNSTKGGTTWRGYERRPQWACPSCQGPNGGATLNRDSRPCCHRCGESRPSDYDSGKGLGKGAKSGGKNGVRRGFSPVGADGKRPLLGRGGTGGNQGDSRVRGRTPTGGLRGGKLVQPQSLGELRPRSYADATREGGTDAATTTPTTTTTALQTGINKGKGGTAPELDGQGKGDGGKTGGYTIVNYRAGKKPRVGEEGLADRSADDADARGDDRPAEYYMDDDWAGNDEWDDYDGDEHAYGDDGRAADDDQGEEAAEDGGPEWDLDHAKREAKGCRELFWHLRKSLGKNHAHTRRAHASLMEAEQRERELKGPQSYWQRGRKDAKRKAVLLRMVEKWSADYEEKEELFQEKAYRHQESQQETLDKISEAREELRGIQERDEAYARLQEGGEPYANPREEAPHEVLRETANQLAVIIEAAGTGQIEQVSEKLNLLSAQLGRSLQRRPWREDRHEDDGGCKGKASERGTGPHTGAKHQGEAPSRWRNRGNGGPNEDDGGDHGTTEDRKEEQDRREAKLAARARGDGGGTGMETDPTTTETAAGAAGGTAAGGATTQHGAAEERRWQRALDTIRGRLLLAKTHQLAERQRQLIAEGALPEPHEWTEEQLRQNQRQIEISNAEVDAEAEKELLAMPPEARTRLLEAAAG